MKNKHQNSAFTIDVSIIRVINNYKNKIKIHYINVFYDFFCFKIKIRFINVLFLKNIFDFFLFQNQKLFFAIVFFLPKKIFQKQSICKSFSCKIRTRHTIRTNNKKRVQSSVAQTKTPCPKSIVYSKTIQYLSLHLIAFS